MCFEALSYKYDISLLYNSQSNYLVFVLTAWLQDDICDSHKYYFEGWYVNRFIGMFYLQLPNYNLILNDNDWADLNATNPV